MLFALTLIVVLGIGAFAVDLSFMRLAQMQVQDVADAASQAAVIVLRQTGDEEEAEAAAREVTERNFVVGEAPELLSLEWGEWDDTVSPATWTVGAVDANGARVTVGRVDDNEANYVLARIWDYTTFPVQASATSASRSSQVVFVLDITGSWGEGDFYQAREAMLLGLERFAAVASGIDEVGMTIFTNRFAWEYTPLTRISEPGAYEAIEADWAVLNIASKAGVDTDHYDKKACKLHSSPNTNNFTNPEGGCYPDMPREYRDEPGTDHSTGIGLARQMFEESDSPAAYRAMIIVTDGRPNGISTAGTARAADDYVEERWREYLGPVPHTTNEIRLDSIAAAEAVWDDLAVHTWIVSYVADDWFMADVPQGDGYYTRTSSAAELSAIIDRILDELPIAIVE